MLLPSGVPFVSFFFTMFKVSFFFVLCVQLVDKDPERAIPLFWAAINAGDRVDSALKDMAIVMKQQNRAEEAIEAIKSLRSRCSDQAQESLDNILLDLYKVISPNYYLFHIYSTGPYTSLSILIEATFILTEVWET